MDPDPDFPEGFPALDFLDMLEQFLQLGIFLLQLPVLLVQGLVQPLEFRDITGSQLPVGLPLE